MIRKGKQQGVVLVTVLLLVVVGVSYVLLRALNTGANRQGVQDETTKAALMAAKTALIGYAVNSPGLTDGNSGPGRLPCPDLDGDGRAAGSCSLTGANATTGWLPYFELGGTRFVDASGTPLWYAVAESHRYFVQTPMNSETGDDTNDLTVDARNGIVAVIIAPGAEVQRQIRGPRANIADYLEGQNASDQDSVFATSAGGEFNDELVFITRAELMNAVEQRVAREVVSALSRFFVDPDGDDTNGVDPDCAPEQASCDDGFPWLQEFTDPRTTLVNPSPGTQQGWLPVVGSGDKFRSDFALAWRVDEPSAIQDMRAKTTLEAQACETRTAEEKEEQSDAACKKAFTDDVGDSAPPYFDCIRFNACFDSVLGKTVPEDAAAILGSDLSDTCTWNGILAIDCTTSLEIPGAMVEGTAQDVIRTYRVSISTSADNPPRIDAPDATQPRRRSVNRNAGNQDRLEGTITVTDSLKSSPKTVLGYGTVAVKDVNFDAANSFSITNVAFPIASNREEVEEVPTLDSPGALPEWFTENNWHHALYVAYANAEAPGAAALNCLDPGPCLTVNRTRKPPSQQIDTLTAVRGLAILAGAALANTDPDLAQNRDSGAAPNVLDYFESTIDSNDLIFDHGRPSPTYNDTVIIVDPYRHFCAYNPDVPNPETGTRCFCELHPDTNDCE